MLVKSNSVKAIIRNKETNSNTIIKDENELSVKNSEEPVVSVETQLRELNIKIRNRKADQIKDQKSYTKVSALQLDQIQQEAFDHEAVSTNQITAKLLSSSSRNIPHFKFKIEDTDKAQVSTATSIPKFSSAKKPVYKSFFDG